MALEDLAYTLHAIAESNRKVVIAALRQVADAIEKGELAHVSGGIAMQGSPDDGWVTINSDLHLRKPTTVN